MREFNAVGITGGVGSLLWGAKQEGFTILGNHEWRKYYGTGSFEINFDGAPLVKDYDTVLAKSSQRIDFISSHAECGNFSNLYTGPNRDSRQIDPGDLWEFINLCAKYRPRFFLADNLVKSLGAVTPDEWRAAFPAYNITFEWVSNFHYGNTQKNRRRMFIIGSLKELNYKFIPGEVVHERQLIDAIADIPGDAPNHQKMFLGDMTQWSGYQIGRPDKDRRLFLKELQPWLRSSKLGCNMPYYNKAGELKSKPGYSVIRTEHPSPVLSGGGGFYDNHWMEDGYIRPLTMRERLRIQGFPDHFLLTPDEFPWGTKDHMNLIKQTGKCMPNEFPTYFAKQIKCFLENPGTVPPCSGDRLTNIPEEIRMDMSNNPDLYHI